MGKYKAIYDEAKYEANFSPYYYECSSSACRSYYLRLIDTATNHLFQESWEYISNGVTYYMENSYMEKTFYLKGGGKEYT